MQKEFYIEDIKFVKHIKRDIKNIDNLTNFKKLIYFINKKVFLI